MTSVLAIGGTRFIGRHTVSAFLDDDHTVTLFNRGNHENPFADDDRTETIHGDRTVASDVTDVAKQVNPDIVLDFAAYKPANLRTAIEAFSDAEAYVYVSSVAVYERGPVMKYEDETPLVSCSPTQADDDTMATYGRRKAEGDRVVFDAAADGIAVMSVRPSMVYGPYDYSGQFDYWIDRVRSNDRVLVPGDGSFVCHRSYVENVASAIRAVAEAGEAGDAYNVGDRQPQTMDQMLEAIADAAGTDIDPLHVSERELAEADLSRSDFPLFMQPTSFVLSTAKLSKLGWEPTPVETGIQRTVEYATTSGGSEGHHWPSREAEASLLGSID